MRIASPLLTIILVLLASCAQPPRHAPEPPAYTCPPACQKALNAVKSKGLIPSRDYDDEVSEEISTYSDFTKYVFSELQNNICGLGDGNNVARLYIFSSLCSSLDTIGNPATLPQKRKEAIKYAMWLCEDDLLELPNLRHFLSLLPAEAAY